jgi:hypothetical protein
MECIIHVNINVGHFLTEILPDAQILHLVNVFVDMKVDAHEVSSV